MLREAAAVVITVAVCLPGKPGDANTTGPSLILKKPAGRQGQSGARTDVIASIKTQGSSAPCKAC
jgi:hypothetical protein